jgi:very-short-patch-repair endonuclease
MPAERELVGGMREQLRARPEPAIDRAVAELAECQHGHVDIDDLRELGLTDAAIQHRIRRGLLHPVHRGVYAVGHSILGIEGRWHAAVRACGPGAVLSHRAAAELHGLVERRGGTIDITVNGRPGKRPGIRTHEAAVLADADRTQVDGIPVTTVARTLIDLAAAEPRSVESAMGRAERRGLLDLDALDGAIARARGRRGVGRLRALRAEFRPTAEFIRSELERRFLALCRKHDLPRPKANLWITVPGDGFEVDFCWPAPRLIVETDSGWHDDTLSRRRDHRRDRLLTAAGWRVVRVRWADVVDTPARTAARIRALLTPEREVVGDIRE